MTLGLVLLMVDNMGSSCYFQLIEFKILICDWVVVIAISGYLFKV